MLAFENETTEYKRELTEGLKKEVLAFANTAGGSIYIGVEDDGTVVGVEQPDDVMLRISGMLRDSIHPDILMFDGEQVASRMAVPTFSSAAPLSCPCAASC